MKELEIRMLDQFNEAYPNLANDVLAYNAVDSNHLKVQLGGGVVYVYNKCNNNLIALNTYDGWALNVKNTWGEVDADI